MREIILLCIVFVILSLVKKTAEGITKWELVIEELLGKEV